MTTFVKPNSIPRHEGAERVELIASSVAHAVSNATRQINSTRRMGVTLQVGTILLSAIVSALLFASDRLVNDWSNGSMVWAWVTLWCIAFLVLSLLIQPVRRTVQWLRHDAKTAIAAKYTQWQAHRAAVRADEAMWAYAQQDPRLMAEIQARLGGR